jgi:hypothetical protein
VESFGEFVDGFVERVAKFQESELRGEVVHATIERRSEGQMRERRGERVNRVVKITIECEMSNARRELVDFAIETIAESDVCDRGWQYGKRTQYFISQVNFRYERKILHIASVHAQSFWAKLFQGNPFCSV